MTVYSDSLADCAAEFAALRRCVRETALEAAADTLAAGDLGIPAQYRSRRVFEISADVEQGLTDLEVLTRWIGQHPTASGMETLAVLLDRGQR